MATKNPNPTSSKKANSALPHMSTGDVASFRAVSERGKTREFSSVVMVEEVGDGSLAVFESLDGDVVSVDLGEDPVRVCLWDSEGIPDPESFSGDLVAFSASSVQFGA